MNQMMIFKYKILNINKIKNEIKITFDLLLHKPLSTFKDK